MEKLQNALSKARAKRQSAGVVPSASVAAPPKPGGVVKPPPMTPGTLGSDKAKPKAKRVSAPARMTPQETVAARWATLDPFEPDATLLQRNLVMTMNAVSSSNPFDMLRTKIYLLMKQHGWKRMAITSPTPSCGKTTTACNLAVGFSRQLEVKTMLFDMDFRRPGVARTLGGRPDYDTRDLLDGSASSRQQLRRLRTNVAISMVGKVVRDPTQILIAQQTADRLDALEKEYDPNVMIFDLPPMLASDDASAFLKNVDCALILARAEHTRMSQLDTCEHEVGQYTNVLGVVLNNCRHVESEEYYGEYD